MSIITLADFDRFTSGLIGLPAWGVELGDGSFVTVNFGAPSAQDPKCGEFFLWVYYTAWRIEDPERIVGCYGDEREEMQAAVARLEGKRLLSIEVEGLSLSARFEFDDGLVLRTFSIYTTATEHWALQIPSGQWAVAGPGPVMALVDGDA